MTKLEKIARKLSEAAWVVSDSAESAMHKLWCLMESKEHRDRLKEKDPFFVIEDGLVYIAGDGEAVQLFSLDSLLCVRFDINRYRRSYCSFVDGEFEVDVYYLCNGQVFRTWLTFRSRDNLFRLKHIMLKTGKFLRVSNGNMMLCNSRSGADLMFFKCGMTVGFNKYVNFYKKKLDGSDLRTYVKVNSSWEVLFDSYERSDIDWFSGKNGVIDADGDLTIYPEQKNEKNFDRKTEEMAGQP